VGVDSRPIIGDLAEDHAVICVCCGWGGEAFAPFGAVRKRPNAQCPECGALERHRLLYSYLRSQTGLFQAPARLLHVAPEPALARIFRATPTIDYVTIDLFDRNVSMRMDLLDLLFRDNVFDCILCSHVLEHVTDDYRAMREMRRVLKPDGFAVIQVPVYDQACTIEDPLLTDEYERIRRFGQRDHVRKYGRDFPDRLAAVFDVCSNRYPEGFTADDTRRFGFAPAVIPTCRKRTS
jgi:SAM-dependent methyltransferase